MYGRNARSTRVGRYIAFTVRYTLYSVHYTACKVGGDYRSRVEEREREKEGWLKKAVFNEA